MEQIQIRKGNLRLKIDLQSDLRPTAGSRQSDRALPELQGAEPQRQEIPAYNPADEVNRHSYPEPEGLHLSVRCLKVIFF